MAGKKFNIEITAQDKTEAALKSVEKGFGAITKGTPLEKIVKGFADIQGRREGLRQIGAAFGVIGNAARGSASGVGEAAAAGEDLGAALGVVGLAAGATVVGLGAAGAAAFKFEADYSRAGAAVGLFAKAIGISAHDLQQYQIAGEKTQVTAEAMAAAFQGVGSTMEDAVAGRNQGALALMSRLGIQVHRLADGSVDAKRGVDDIAKAMQGQNRQAQALIAGQFGAAGALNFLIETQAEREAQLREADASGAIRSQKQIDDDIRVQGALKRMDDEWHSLLNALSEKVIIPWVQPLLDGLLKITTGADRADRAVRKVAGIGYAVEGALLGNPAGLIGMFNGGGKGGAPAAAGASTPSFAGGAGDGRAGGSDASAKAMGYFMAQGWTKAQAAGIVENLIAESGLSPHAVGDHGRALGIAQWHADRQDAFARRYGHQVGMAGISEQLDFVQYELTHGSRRAAGDRLRGTTEAGDAGAAVSRYYESPADASGQAAARASGARHLVTVDVNLKGAPAGSTVVAQTSGPAVRANARVAGQMWGGPI